MVQQHEPHKAAREVVEEYSHKVVGVGHGGGASYLDIIFQQSTVTGLGKSETKDLLKQGIIVSACGELDDTGKRVKRVWFDTLDLEHSDDGMELRLHNESY